MRRLALVSVCVAALSLTAVTRAANRPTGVVNTCAGQSSAGFPHVFTSDRNLVVGPLVMVGAGELTTAETVRMFGGNKFPLLVAAGHRVTIELTRATRRFASLSYGHWSHGGEQTVRDGHRVVTFRSCKRTHALSRADGRRVTFWSGFVLASRPGCVPLRVWVDDEPAPRSAAIELGARCGR